MHKKLPYERDIAAPESKPEAGPPEQRCRVPRIEVRSGARQPPGSESGDVSHDSHEIELARIYEEGKTRRSQVREESKTARVRIKQKAKTLRVVLKLLTAAGGIYIGLTSQWAVTLIEKIVPHGS